MNNEYHVFVDGDAGRCGTILRHIEPRRMRTRTALRMGQDALIRQFIRQSADEPIV